MADQDSSTWDKTEEAEGFREQIGKQHSDTEMPPALSMPDEAMSLQDSDAAPEMEGQTADSAIEDDLT